MAFISVFDVLGPNMIGPSSSHTAGAEIIAFLAQKMIAPPLRRVDFTLYGSFAKTYHGHGTDRALLGGGKVRIVRINGVEVDFTGEYNALIVVQQDKPGVVAHITKILSDRGVNIAFMRLFREEKGHTAYTIVESDERLPEGVDQLLLENPNIRDVMVVQQ